MKTARNLYISATMAGTLFAICAAYVANMIAQDVQTHATPTPTPMQRLVSDRVIKEQFVQFAGVEDVPWLYLKQKQRNSDWSSKNLMFESKREPIVTKDGQQWLITFKEKP